MQIVVERQPDISRGGDVAVVPEEHQRAGEPALRVPARDVQERRDDGRRGLGRLVGVAEDQRRQHRERALRAVGVEDGTRVPEMRRAAPVIAGEQRVEREVILARAPRRRGAGEPAKRRRSRRCASTRRQARARASARIVVRPIEGPGQRRGAVSGRVGEVPEDRKDDVAPAVLLDVRPVDREERVDRPARIAVVEEEQAREPVARPVGALALEEEKRWHDGHRALAVLGVDKQREQADGVGVGGRAFEVGADDGRLPPAERGVPEERRERVDPSPLARRMRK